MGSDMQSLIRMYLNLKGYSTVAIANFFHQPQLCDLMWIYWYYLSLVVYSLWR